MATERTEKTVWVEGGTLSGVVVMALALFAMVNYLASRHYTRWDWTSSQLYTLSEKSEKVLKDLDRDVEAAIFMSPASPLYNAVDELLARYEAANPTRFKKRIVDPAKDILEVQRLVDEYNIGRGNVVVVASGGDQLVIDERELAEYDYSGAQMGQAPVLKEFKGEQQITSAILELVEAKKPKVVLTTGHGEAVQALTKARDFLDNDNFEIEEWSSIESSQLPEDADVVMVASPSTRFLEGELDLFTRYLEGGGRLLFLLDPLPPGAGGIFADPLLTEWLGRYGVDMGDDVVIDPNIQLAFYPAETLYSATYGYHPIVQNLDEGGRPVLFPASRSVRRSADVPLGHEVTELIKTSEDAWGETDIEDVSPTEGEAQGAVSIGVAVSMEVLGDSPESTAAAPDAAAPDTEATDEEEKAPEARLVVFGDIDFVADAQIESVGNVELLLNTFNWLVERDQLIAIEGRQPEETRLSLTASELSSIYLLVMLVMPGSAIFMGIWTYLRRRR